MPPSSEHATQAAAPPAASPPPARVPGNLWTDIDAPELGAFDPVARVSVIVSGPDPDSRTDLTLEGLGRQSYPARLIEVLVASEPGAGEAEPSAAEHDAGTLVRAGSRAEAARAATGDVLIFLPRGAVPGPQLVEAHARWHHAVEDAVTVGLSRGAGETALDAYLERTRGLTERRPDLFRVAARQNVGLRAATFRGVGGERDLGEEHLARLDLAYRLDNHGCVFVPERGAEARLHYEEAEPEPPLGQERDDGGEAGPARPEDPRVADLIPVPGFRPRGAGRLFARRSMVVNVAVRDERAVEVLECVDSVLRGRLSDIELRLLVPEDHAERAAIAEACASDPRIAIGPANGAAVDAPYEATLPAGVMPGEHTLQQLYDMMLDGQAGVLRATLPVRLGGLTVERPALAARLPSRPALRVEATGARARARRVAGRDGEPAEAVLAELFGERSVKGAEVGLRRQGLSEPRDRYSDGLAPASDLAHERAEHLRHRARAATNQARVDRSAQRAVRERLRANHERTRAERLEARLARISAVHFVRWQVKRLARRARALPARLGQRLERVRGALYRVKRLARGRRSESPG